MLQLGPSIVLSQTPNFLYVYFKLPKYDHVPFFFPIPQTITTQIPFHIVFYLLLKLVKW